MKFELFSVLIFQSCLLIVFGKEYKYIEQELESKILAHLQNADYQPTVRPPPVIEKEGSHQAVLIKLNIHILGFSSISVANNDFTMDVILRQEWIDKRLVTNDSYNFLSIGYLKKRLWTPDLYFRNSKKSSTHEVTKPNHLIWLYPNGTLIFSQKLTVTLFCDMNLWNFPLDTQICTMDIGSYGYSIEDLKFEWWTIGDTKAVSLKEPMHLNEFYQPFIEVHYCNTTFSLGERFSCLQANFTLVRKFGFYLIYTYMPSFFIVSISWVSFFIDYKAVPARISLGLLALLALMTQSSSVVEKLPRVSYVKAIDIWMFACLAFVISSLFEYALVNCLARFEEKEKLKRRMQKVIRSELMTMSSSIVRAQTPSRVSPSNTGIELENPVSSSENNTTNQNLKFQEEHFSNLLNDHNFSFSDINKPLKLSPICGMKVRKIDKIFSLWFPIFFIIFNIFYWYIFYTNF